MTNKIVRAQLQPPAKSTGQIGHGAPCKYNKFTMLPVVTAMAKIGATNADMAAALDVSLRTFTTWCGQFPELREAVHVGKELFDARVERALAERALGYYASWEEDMIGPAGTPMLLKKVKYIEPNVQAIRLWLTNRKPEDWKDKQVQQVDIKRETPEEVHADLVKHFLQLRAEGYLRHIELDALPSPEDYEEEADD
jgi:hypothetical protein